MRWCGRLLGLRRRGGPLRRYRSLGRRQLRTCRRRLWGSTHPLIRVAGRWALRALGTTRAIHAAVLEATTAAAWTALMTPGPACGQGGLSGRSMRRRVRVAVRTALPFTRLRAFSCDFLLSGLRIPAHAGCRGTCRRRYLAGRCGALHGVRSDFRPSGLRVPARSQRRGTRCKALPRPSLQGLGGGHGLRRVRDQRSVARAGLHVSRRGPGRGRNLCEAGATRRKIPLARLRGPARRVGLRRVRNLGSVARAGLHVSRRGPGRGRGLRGAGAARRRIPRASVRSLGRRVGLRRVRDLGSVARAGLHVSRRGPGRGR